MSLVLGVDIGGSTRNGITLMNSEDESVVEYSYIEFTSKTKYEHRQRVLDEVNRYLSEYNIDYMLFEDISLYRGGKVSPLVNIVSLAKMHTKFIDNLSDKLDIYTTPVQSWKSDILNSRYATKFDSIRFVEAYYPQVNLKLVIKHKRKDDEIIDNHDLADSVCIALHGCRHPEKLKKINYT